MKTMNFGEHWGSMEKMFLPKNEIAATFSAAISTVFLENARHFWEYQEKVWHNMQVVADGWFERRRIETQKAREAAETMCRFESFEDLFRTHRDWAIGAFDRIMAEALWSIRIAVPARIKKIGKLSRSESKFLPAQTLRES